MYFAVEKKKINKKKKKSTVYQLPENLNINTNEFETKATSPLTSPRTVIVTETDMIETVAIQDEMTQQTSLLDHSEEQVQQEMETITKMHMGPVIHRKYQQNQTMEKQKRYTL